MSTLASLTACLLTIVPAGETPSTPLGQKAFDGRPVQSPAGETPSTPLGQKAHDGGPAQSPPAPPPPEPGAKQHWLDLGFLVGAGALNAVQPVSGPERDASVLPLAGLTVGLRGGYLVGGVGGTISSNANERSWGAHFGVIGEQGPLHLELAAEIGGHHLYNIGGRTYHRTDASARLPYLGFHLKVGSVVNPKRHLRAGVIIFGRWDLDKIGVVAKDVECSGPLMGDFPFYTRPTVCEPDQMLNVGGFMFGAAIFGTVSPH
jgi:hypothetical protein